MIAFSTTSSIGALVVTVVALAPAPPVANAQVIIGGAGYAGVSAAKVLAEHGVNIILLEATDHLGGRMYAKPFGMNPATGESYMLDAGANWVQGLEGNPVWGDAIKYGLGGTIQKFDDLVLFDQNGDYNQLETVYGDGSLCLKAYDAYVGAGVLSKTCIQPPAASSPDASSDDKPDEKVKKRKLKSGKKASKSDNASTKKNDILQKDETYEELCRVLLQKKKFRFKDDDDISSGEAGKLVSDFNPPEEQNEAIARVCQYFSQDFEHAELPAVTSLNNTLPSNTYTWFEDADYWVNDHRGGFGWLVQSVAAEFLITSVNTNEAKVFDDKRLMLNTKVLKVAYDPDGDAPGSQVSITVCDTVKESSNNNPDSWICQAGTEREISGDHFISTFSMGVLGETIKQEEEAPLADATDSQELGFAPVFEPPLSSNKGLKKSISSYPMAYYTKMFFQFPEKFWGDSEVFLSAAIGTSKSGRTWTGDFAPIWQSLDVTEEGFLPGSKIMFVTVTGERAFELQTDYTDDEIIAEMLPVLNSIFEDNITLTKDNVLDFSMTRWVTDPLTRGMFTNRRVGVSWEDAEPSRALYGNLMFTGEHACFAFNGYTHSAKLAGERTARILLRERYGMAEADRIQSICDVSPFDDSPRLQTGGSMNPPDHVHHSRGYPIVNSPTNVDISDRFQAAGTSRRSLLNGKRK
jgi:hypothetical protein